MTDGHCEALTHEPRKPRLEPARRLLPASGDDDFIRHECGERVLDGFERVFPGDLPRNVVVANAVEGCLHPGARLIQEAVDRTSQAGCGGDHRRHEQLHVHTRR